MARATVRDIVAYSGPGPSVRSHPDPADPYAAEPDPGVTVAPRLHHWLFVVLVLAAVTPVMVLAAWENRAALRSERDAAGDRTLMAARGVAATLSRYAGDLKASVDLTFSADPRLLPSPDLVALLSSFGVQDVCVLAQDDTERACLPSLPGRGQPPTHPALLARLRGLAAAEPIALSDLYHDQAGRPVFYLARQMSDGGLGVAVIGTDFLAALPPPTGFGAVVVTDARGQVMAITAGDAAVASRDWRSEPVVAAMLRGESGVGTLSGGDALLAGYTTVPETGWGILVPRAVATLFARSGQVMVHGLTLAGAALAAALVMGWLCARYLTRPVRTMTATAEAVLAGDDAASVPVFNGAVPPDIRRLGATLNRMLAYMRHRVEQAGQTPPPAETMEPIQVQPLAGMSHEIRAGLNGIVGAVELLQLTELTGVQRRYLEAAAQSGKSLLRLVDDSLDLSAIESGQLRLEPAPFHLPSLLLDVRMLFAAQARAKGLTLSLLIPDSLNLMLVGDANRLLQIMTNLMSNAVKFTVDGRITIRVAMEQAIGSSMRLRFEVSDTGIGIPRGRQPGIFDALAANDGSTTRRFSGRGLGLPIASQLCRLMGGEIGLESTVGVGSSFWFTVFLERQFGPLLAAPPPLISDTPPGEYPGAPPGASPADPADDFPAPASRAFRLALRQQGRESLSILLVEDNPSNMRVTRALLNSLGCSVTSACNGLEAVSAYRDGRFDLVLMDCQMAEMDGYEAAHAIRQIEAYRSFRTPIIALTAHAMPGSREASLASGMDDHLLKPLTMAVLTGKLLEWLRPPEAVPDQATGFGLSAPQQA